MMEHLTDDELYTVAKNTVNHEPLGEGEERALQHISVCDECYEKLQELMAILILSDQENVQEWKAAEQKLKEEQVKIILAIRIKMIGESLRLSAEENYHEGDKWKFFQRAGSSRGINGNDTGNGQLKLSNYASEYSGITVDAERGIITAQLDEEILGREKLNLITREKDSGKIYASAFLKDENGIRTAEARMPKTDFDILIKGSH